MSLLIFGHDGTPHFLVEYSLGGGLCLKTSRMDLKLSPTIFLYDHV